MILAGCSDICSTPIVNKDSLRTVHFLTDRCGSKACYQQGQLGLAVAPNSYDLYSRGSRNSKRTDDKNRVLYQWELWIVMFPSKGSIEKISPSLKIIPKNSLILCNYSISLCVIIEKWKQKNVRVIMYACVCTYIQFIESVCWQRKKVTDLFYASKFQIQNEMILDIFCPLKLSWK